MDLLIGLFWRIIDYIKHRGSVADLKDDDLPVPPEDSTYDEFLQKYLSERKLTFPSSV